jgi:parallel beta-helix repeat protein
MKLQLTAVREELIRYSRDAQEKTNSQHGEGVFKALSSSKALPSSAFFTGNPPISVLPVIQRRMVLRFVVAATIAAMIIVCGQPVSARATTVTLSPGDSIQNEVSKNPAGTTFVLPAGTYRRDSLTSLKNGDSFIGDNGAIMDGAKVLTGWTQVSIKGHYYWTTAGGTPLATPACTTGKTVSGGTVPCCLPGYPGCVYVQDLYLDDVDYQHVTSLADVVAGTSWYYDFRGGDGGIKNNIYLAAGDDPKSHSVELGDTMHAFMSSASDITIKNLTIEKYAAPIQSAAVQVQGPGWLIEDNEVLLNHGVGISAKQGGDNIQVLGNNVHHNGEIGFGGPANGGRWDSNEIAFNNVDRVNTDFCGGGSKFVGSNITVSNNIAHDNYGTGLFTDSGGSHDTYDHNTSYNNYGGGIRYETSRYGTITNNTVYGNSKTAQIVYTGSDHGRISGNTVIDNGVGAIVVVNTTGSRVGTVFKVTDTQVTGNTIWTSSNENDVVAGLIDHAQPAQPSIFSDPTNFFNSNIYEFSGSVRSSWHWGETANPLDPISWTTWRDDKQDPHGSVKDGVPEP